MADNITFRFLQNVGDYFPSGYLTDDFAEKVQKCAARTDDEMKEMNKRFVPLRAKYEEYKNFIVNARPRVQDAIRRTHAWHTELLRILGYDPANAYQEPYVVSDEGDVAEMIPVRHILRDGSGISLLVMEMQPLISVGEQVPAGLFEQQYDSEPDRLTRQQRYTASQWAGVVPAQFLDRNRYRFSPAIINRAITQIFLMPEERRPHFILMLAGNTVFLFAADRWARGSYLQLSLDDLYAQGQLRTARNHYALFQLLVGKEALSADGQTVLMDTLIEESYRNAYEVTKDLREGVILAVETLANEALYYMREVAHRPFGQQHTAPDGTVTYDETDDNFETEVKDDCLTIVYRLLFIFFAESRPELDILPTADEVYKRGYSLEALRDLEQVRLNGQEARSGYFFDDSMRLLFALLAQGYHHDRPADRSFRVRPIDSPIFDDRRLRRLRDVRLRNVKWQEIIRALSLTRGRRYAGRISYANLGVNQLGSVYESLLAYRGFYAEEDYIEVCKDGDTSNGTYLVPYSRMSQFSVREVVCDDEGHPRRLPRGTFVYRLNGRDRQRSASYYTPEALTRSTVKYTLKAIVDRVRTGELRPDELLRLKILEPAVGAAAFLGEVINQLAVAYMTYAKRKPAPDRYRDELQKVKAYIATHNVYGVDLNPTAIELGKLSLWLGVIHRDMEPPFFAGRLTVGNAVVGAALKVYRQSEVVTRVEGRRKKPNEWWTKAPHKVAFYRERVKRSVSEVYHFLLPSKGMLAALGIGEMKKAHPEEARLMAARLRDWTAPVSRDDFPRLQRLSAKIDVLLHEVLNTQMNIERLTANLANVWGMAGQQELGMEMYAEKERILDTRYRRDNAYYKLRLVMDYWCALWFWEYADADALPTREEYWTEIERLLDVPDERLDAATRRAMESANAVGEQLELDYGDGHMTEKQAGVVERSKREILEDTHAQLTLFADEEPRRFAIVKRLAARYRFFHPMLEFIEVFWLRGGFDIVCGNPPWIKLQFDDKAVVSERYPEVMVHRTSAPQARALLTDFLRDDAMRAIYEAEQMEMQCTSVFLGAEANYPLLRGQQTNLYKCVLSNTFDWVNAKQGYIGLLCPESIYDDPNGGELRRELYMRLRYHFQYLNELRLFAEVHHSTVYGDQVLGPRRSSSPSFASISNLFHPNTVDACFAHDGHGPCGGIKDEAGHWNTAAHRDRIVHFGEDELRVLAKTFEDSDDWEAAKLVGVQNKDIIEVLRSLSAFPHHVADYERIISVGLDEAIAVDKGWMVRNTCYPDWDKQQMIFSGPHIYVGNPLYKTPRQSCTRNSDYDIIDLERADDNYSARTNYTPCLPLPEYRGLIKGFPKGQNAEGEQEYEAWMDYYKVAMRRMTGGGAGERTLTGAILPRYSMHMGSVTSVVFKDIDKTVEFAGLSASLVLDFYIKTIGINDIHASRVEMFPLGISPKYQTALFARVLRLNCVTRRYADLWREAWREDYRREQWSVADERLPSWDGLKPEWTVDTPLRNAFARRQALIEIDVLAAMALGLTLRELTMMYEIQFPVLRQNEGDTWYDRRGKVVFTTSKGLNGVGVDRPTWQRIHALPPGGTYRHTLQSELYAGASVTYEAPFVCPDRVADYRRAWQHFEALQMHAPSTT